MKGVNMKYVLIIILCLFCNIGIVKSEPVNKSILCENIRGFAKTIEHDYPHTYSFLYCLSGSLEMSNHEEKVFEAMVILEPWVSEQIEILKLKILHNSKKKDI